MKSLYPYILFRDARVYLYMGFCNTCMQSVYVYTLFSNAWMQSVYIYTVFLRSMYAKHVPLHAFQGKCVLYPLTRSKDKIIQFQVTCRPPQLLLLQGPEQTWQTSWMWQQSSIMCMYCFVFDSILNISHELSLGPSSIIFHGVSLKHCQFKIQ